MKQRKRSFFKEKAKFKFTLYHPLGTQTWADFLIQLSQTKVIKLRVVNANLMSTGVVMGLHEPNRAPPPHYKCQEHLSPQFFTSLYHAELI